MYEETKDMITRELRAIVENGGVATAIGMVERKTNSDICAIISTARHALELYPKHPHAKTLEKEVQRLDFLLSEHSNALKSIARNAHGELRAGAWIEYHEPYNPDTSTTPQEVKDIYAKAQQSLVLLMAQARNVLDLYAGINPDTTHQAGTDPATFEPVATYTHPNEYPNELTDEEVAQIQEYFAQAGFQVSRTAIWWQFTGWHVGAKSGYRDDGNGYHLFTPVNYNPFSIALTRLTPTGETWQTTYHH